MSEAKRRNIPKKIHFCWFGGKDLTPLAVRCIESWKKNCPDYEIVRWDESNFDININKYVKQAYESKKWAFVTDYVRLRVLYEYGGIYMDTDVEVLKCLDDFLNKPAFTGFESFDRIPTGIIGGSKGNKWIGELLKDYDNRNFIHTDGTYDLTTNVKLITDTTKRMYSISLNNTFQNFEHVAFYPQDWFCAKDLSTGKIMKTENTYCIHHFAGSWVTPKKKIIKKLVAIFGPKFVNNLVKIKHMLKRY